MFKKLIGLATALSFSAVTSAAIITDTVDQLVKLDWLQSHTYQHDINDDGFTLGSALSGTLEVLVSDDDDIEVCLPFIGCNEAPEAALFVVEGFDFDTGGLVFGSAFVGDLEINALGALNADGYLDVTVTSILGDFYVGQSTLTVVTDSVASVPEPGVLALLGLGLLGLRVARPRA